MAAEPQRNVEVKATDPDPERSLAAVRAVGAEDQGVIRQRDTYFRVPSGRLKLREESPGAPHLVQYERADRAEARESRYRLVPVADADALRAALDAALGTLVVVEKARHLLLWGDVRIHLDRVEGLGTFVELEGVVAPGADLEPERARVARLVAALGLTDDRVLAHSYADALLAPAAPELFAAARAAMARAHAPYSRYRVGAALRAPDGSIHVGANVENAAYPQGQCAEASAVGALVAAGHAAIAEAAVVAQDVAAPCGGCRQRLSEFAHPDVHVHLGDGEGLRRTVTVGELLPLAFGAERLPR
jgi:homotetrameric cytidine deaminase